MASSSNHRADIYSLGCTLYYLLAGRSVFAGDTLAQKIMAHRERPKPRDGDAVAPLPVGLSVVNIAGRGSLGGGSGEILAMAGLCYHPYPRWAKDAPGLDHPRVRWKAEDDWRG